MFKYIATVCITFADRIGGEAYTAILASRKPLPRNNSNSELDENSEEYKQAIAIVKENSIDTSRNMVMSIKIQEEFSLIDIVL